MTPEEYIEKLKEAQRTLDSDGSRQVTRAWNSRAVWQLWRAVNILNWPTAASMRQQRQK